MGEFDRLRRSKEDQTDFLQSIVPDVPEKWIAGNLTLSDAPSAPDAGVVYGSYWISSWTTAANIGTPAARHWLRCVAFGGACTDSVVALSSGTALGLTPNGTTYDCYTVAINLVGTVCSTTSTPVTMPVIGGPFYTISRPNGSVWTWQSSDNTIRLRVGTPLSFSLLTAIAELSPLIRETGPSFTYLAAIPLEGMSAMTFLSFAGWRGLLEVAPNYQFSFWRNPSGGWGIQTSDGLRFLGYEEAGDRVRMVSDDTNVVLNWEISPDPPESLVSGNFSLADAPSEPATGEVYAINFYKTTWTTGVSKGYPVARYYLRCLALGSACTDAGTKYESGSVPGTGTQEGSMTGFTIDTTYSCYGGFPHILFNTGPRLIRGSVSQWLQRTLSARCVRLRRRQLSSPRDRDNECPARSVYMNSINCAG